MAKRSTQVNNQNMVIDRKLEWAILLDDIELKSISQNPNNLDLSEVSLLFTFGTFVNPEAPKENFFILNRIFIEKRTFNLNPNVIIFKSSDNQDLSYASLPNVEDISFYINEALDRVIFKSETPHRYILIFDQKNSDKQDTFLKTWIKQTLNSSKK